MAGKKTSGRKNPARKKKVPIKDLSSPSQELSEGQARAVKGGAPKGGAPVKRTAGEHSLEYLKYDFEEVFTTS
jgi:hypothetical protein